VFDDLYFFDLELVYSILC